MTDDKKVSQPASIDRDVIVNTLRHVMSGATKSYGYLQITSEFAVALLRELTAAESALAEANERARDQTANYLLATARAEAAESALEKMRESNGDLLMRNVELRHRLDAAERDARSVRDMTAMVDAAMVEMLNISPPMRRSECEQLIKAAIGNSMHMPLVDRTAEPAGKGA